MPWLLKRLRPGEMLHMQIQIPLPLPHLLNLLPRHRIRHITLHAKRATDKNTHLLFALTLLSNDIGQIRSRREVPQRKRKSRPPLVLLLRFRVR